MRRTRFAVSASVAVLVATGCDELSQPENFDQCILRHMDGVTSDRAADLINRSCRATFPDARTGDDTALTDLELSNLAGRFGFFGGSRYIGNVYNGNPDITVTSIIINITATLNDDAISREYRQEVAISPLSAQEVGFNVVVNGGAEYSWEITSARGYRK